MGRHGLPAAGQQIVKRQPDAHLPAGHPITLVLGNDEANRVDRMRRNPCQRCALGQAMAHQAKIKVLQVAQPAVNQLAGGR